MSGASYVQTSFLGGEWAPESQGAMHDPRYKQAMDKCQNYIPLEEDSVTRRPAFKFSDVTKAGGVARNWDFVDAQKAAYNIEAGGGYFRFYKNHALILETTVTAVQSISSATPAVVHATAHPFSNNDYVKFTSLVGAPILRNRQFKVTKLSADTFSIADPMSGAFVGTAVSGFVSANVQRVYEITHPYDSGEVFSVYQLQDQNQQVLLHPSVPPRLLTRTAGTDTFAVTTPAFIDGPYLDPPTDGSTLTPDATTGVITLTASATTGINGGQGFLLTDVGRFVRLYSVPPDWASGSTYAKGALVSYKGEFYSALKGGNTGNTPGTAFTWWALAPSAGTWVWGIIGTFTDSTHVIITTQKANDGTSPVLLNTNAIKVWQLGLYSATTGYPSAGGFHEGRLWLASPVQPNRFDGSMVDKHFDLTPTSPDGTIADDNAVAITAEAEDANPVLWFVSSLKGLLAGTPAGEWLISASQLDDPITPTSIQCRKVTKFGCANVRPAQTPSSLAVVHRPQRKIFEYKWFLDSSAYSVAPNAVPLSLRARHLMTSGIAQVVYQADPFPCIWARRNDGLLVGCSYRRDPQQYFAAWHSHPLGGGVNNPAGAAIPALVQSMAIVPTPDGLSEDLWAVVGRKIPGIIAPDATPNAPVIPTDTVYYPIFTGPDGDYVVPTRVQYDQGASLIYVTCAVNGGPFGLAVFDLTGTLVTASKIDTDGSGTGYARGFKSGPLAMAPGGQYIIGCENSFSFSSSRLFVLNRTTLAHVQHHDSFGDTFQQLLAVNSAETFVFGCDPTFFYAYHISSGLSIKTRWDTMGVNQPAGDPIDASFDSAGHLWIGTSDGHLVKGDLAYTGSNITYTISTTYVPHADGKTIRKLTYNPAHNHMLLWYDPDFGGQGPGRLTRWNIGGAAVYSDLQYPWFSPMGGLAGVPGWFDARSNWNDTTVYADIQVNLTGAVPQIDFFNATNGATQTKRRDYWPGIDYWGEGSSSFINTNAHEIWAGRGANQGIEDLSYDIGSFAVDDVGLGDGTVHYMEFMSPPFDGETMTGAQAFFVDSGRQDTDDPAAVTVSNGVATIAGLHYLEGETITVHLNGLDAGDFFVNKGQIAVPNALASGNAISLGYPYESLGALLPNAEAGGQNGPAAFKLNRNHKYGALLSFTQDIAFSEDHRDFSAKDKLMANGAPTLVPTLFSGRVQDSLKGSEHSLSGKICWRQNRTYPGTVLAVGGFKNVSDI